MEISILIEFSPFLDISINQGTRLKLNSETTVRDILDLLSIKKHHQQFIIPIINQQKQHLSTRLEDGDKLFLQLPVGGG